MIAQQLECPRLRLCPLSPGDVNDRYVSWLNDPEVTRYLHSGRTPSTIESLRSYVGRFEESESDLIWAIIDRASDRHIGNVTLNRISWDHRKADTGLLLGEKDFWGRGYATEAWYLVADHAFRDLALHKVLAGACVANVGSINALKRVGFREEGIAREEFHLNGTYLDVVRLGLLAGELVPHLQEG